MRFKYGIAILLFVALVGVAFLAAPAAAAKDDDSVSVDCPDGYVVTFYKVPTKTVSTSGMVSALAVYDTITQGQYKWHGRVVNYYTTYLDFYLYWGNPSNSLRLRLITPEGYALGPFYDPYDGNYDGAIGVRVSRSGGVAQGTWIEEIYGDRVSGTQGYTI